MIHVACLHGFKETGGLGRRTPPPPICKHDARMRGLDLTASIMRDSGTYLKLAQKQRDGRDGEGGCRPPPPPPICTMLTWGVERIHML